MNSNGKVALVTGGGSGIGKAAAIALAKEGFAAVIGGRRAERLGRSGARDRGVRRADPGGADRRHRPCIGKEHLRQDEGDVRAARRAVQQCRVRRGGADRRTAVRTLEGGHRHDPDGLVPVHAGSVPDHEGPAADGRADHQQRLDFGACAAAEFGRLYLGQARDHRPDQIDVARRPQIRHLLRPDRRRQCR